MKTHLTPVEALQREIDGVNVISESGCPFMLDGKSIALLVALLELAKADAGLVAHQAIEPKHPDPSFIVGTWTFEVFMPWDKKHEELTAALIDARTKLNEALQR